jgi:hypothetical protein
MDLAVSAFIWHEKNRAWRLQVPVKPYMLFDLDPATPNLG